MEEVRGPAAVNAGVSTARLKAQPTAALLKVHHLLGCEDTEKRVGTSAHQRSSCVASCYPAAFTAPPHQ